MRGEVSGGRPPEPAGVGGGRPPEPPRSRSRAQRGKGGRKSGEKTVKLRQVKSGICAPRKQKLTLRGLGLTRIGQTVVRPDDPAIRGMVLQVRHLVEVVEE